MVLTLKSIVVCGRCGEKNSTIHSKCRKCGTKLPLVKKFPQSSRVSTSRSIEKKTCPFCSASITATANYCPKCGQRLEQENDTQENIPQKFEIEFTKNRRSLERTARIFDGIFADPTYRSKTDPDMWDKKKKWYLNQKMRFVERKISNEMFFVQLKSLNEYFGSSVEIPEDKLNLILENSRGKTDTITEVVISKEIPIVAPKLTTEVVTQKLEDLSYSQPSEALPEMPKLEPFISTMATDTKAPIMEPVSEEKKALFSSIQYQVQNLIFEEGKTGPIVRIIPYSGTMKEIRVDFDRDKIMMSGCLKRPNLQLGNLILKTEGEPRQPSWDDPWKDITIIGEEEIIEQIKQRSEIANQLASLGKVEIKVESQNKGDICIQLICNETKETVKNAYSLIKDLQLFLEISFY